MREAQTHYPSTPLNINGLGELKPEDQGLLDAERVVLESTVWRKLDMWVLSLCTGFFFLAFLVRV